MSLHLKRSLIIAFILYIFYLPLKCQDKFEISTGIGEPELINLRIKYGLKLQVGFSIGLLKIQHERFRDISLDGYFHFGGKSKYIDQNPWYLNGGISYQKSNHMGVVYPGNPILEYDKFILQYTRIGRTINFSDKIGLNADLGYILPFHFSKINKQWELMLTYFPSFSFGLFYRL